MTKYEQLEMAIPAKPEYVAIARLTVSGVANRMGYTYDEIEDIKIAVSEACANAVQHAYEENEEGSMTLTCNVYPNDRLEVIVKDSGVTFDKDSVKRQSSPITENHDLDSLHEGGLGILMIEALMDRVTIEKANGVTVHMTKYMNRDEVGQSASKVSTTPSQ
ncbi:anti-sigma B factor RsbW [Exiguobacterium flavidum]|uniref:anti-sigma B factor RsbW n=1 Tax=Exiguobacterium flavidum TaxID=2184695 RepID=UPI000DF838CB|nr:anti-sigma B factor RsbW [Exiguobacterium flavidum]